MDEIDERWENLAETYSEMLAAERGIDPADIDLEYGPDAEVFSEFWELLTSEDKPDNWLDLYGELGFDEEFWTLYGEK